MNFNELIQCIAFGWFSLLEWFGGAIKYVCATLVLAIITMVAMLTGTLGVVLWVWGAAAVFLLLKHCWPYAVWIIVLLFTKED